MADRRSKTKLNTTNFLAERVRQQLEVFPEKFRELGEGGELRDICGTSHTLAGPRVEQAPEDFTEQYLIEPVLHGLGYLNPISDDYTGDGPHFVRRPSTFRNIELKRPDYKLKNISREIVCILEAKAANEEQPQGKKRKATNDIENYINSNTFSKYLENQDQRYLVAIGTDGFRWILWAKDVRTNETKQAIQEVDLANAIEAIAKRDDVIEGEPELDTVEIRDQLSESFIPAFSALSVEEFVKDSFE